MYIYIYIYIYIYTYAYTLKNILISIFSNMPYMKRVYSDKKASAHCSAAKRKERFAFR